MTHLLTGLFFTVAGSAFSQNDIYKEILPTSTKAEIKTLKSDLRIEGIILEIGKIRRKGGDMEQLSLRVRSGDGDVRYSASGFSRIIIERNKDIAIGVRSIPRKESGGSK